MPHANRRQPANSPTAAIVRFSKQTKLPEPPVALREDEMPYYYAIVADRELETWTTNHLIMAANLARTLTAMDSLWSDILAEGFTIENFRGTPIANPKCSALTSLTSAMQSLQRTLGLSASQKAVSNAEQGPRNEADRKSREAAERVEQHDLL